MSQVLNTSQAGRRFFKLCVETFANQKCHPHPIDWSRGGNLAQYGSLPINIYVYERVHN